MSFIYFLAIVLLVLYTPFLRFPLAGLLTVFCIVHLSDFGILGFLVQLFLLPIFALWTLKEFIHMLSITFNLNQHVTPVSPSN